MKASSVAFVLIIPKELLEERLGIITFIYHQSFKQIELALEPQLLLLGLNPVLIMNHREITGSMLKHLQFFCAVTCHLHFLMFLNSFGFHMMFTNASKLRLRWTSVL